MISPEAKRPPEPRLRVGRRGRAVEHEERGSMASWIDACGAGDVENEDVIRFDNGGRTFVIIRSPDDKYFCMDGLCSHEAVHLADGLVMDDIIECPKHNAHFEYRTGEAARAPACINLKTYPTRVENGRVFVEI
jgi:3-phenylpropionate/trans-cinnamate dioxygenase ferredoxin component